MKRWLAWSLAGTFTAFGLVSLSTVGCGGSSNTQAEAGNDGGGGMDHMAPVDHFVPGDAKDAGKKKDSGNPFPDTGVETGPPTEGGPPPPDGGTLLVNTIAKGLTEVQLIGTTEDSAYALYYGYTSSAAGLYAVPIAGGAPIKIFSGTSAASASILHSTVLVWTGITTNSTTMNSIGALSYVWNPTVGVQTVTGVTKSTVGLAAVSPDNTLMAYTTNVNPGGTFGDLVVASTDGTTLAPKTLLTTTATNATTVTTYFDPQLDYVNNSFLVMYHEGSLDSGATSPGTLSTWDTTAWAQTDLTTNLVASASPLKYYWGTADKGASPGQTLAFLSGAGVDGGASGTLETIPTDNSAAATTVASGVSSYVMLDDGTAVLYGTPAGTLSSAPAPFTTTISILSTGFGGFIYACQAQGGEGCSASPQSLDDQYLLFYKNAGKTAGEYDINLVQQAASATPTVLLSAATGAIFQDGFTADSKYALYYTNFKQITAGIVGSLQAYPVNGSKSPPGVTVSTNAVWLSDGVTGSKIVYGDNTVANTSSASGAPPAFEDLWVVDVSATPLKPTAVMATTDINTWGYYITRDRSTLLWVMSQGNTSTNGIWAYNP